MVGCYAYYTELRGISLTSLGTVSISKTWLHGVRWIRSFYCLFLVNYLNFELKSNSFHVVHNRIHHILAVVVRSAVHVSSLVFSVGEYTFQTTLSHE